MKFGGRSHTFDDFIRCKDGNYAVLIAGERRLRAMRLIPEFNNGKAAFEAKVFEVKNAEVFAELIKLQAAENLHEQPAAYQFAVAIYTLYRLGRYRSVAEFVSTAGSAVGEKRARDALSFFTLPEAVRAMTEKNVLAYSTAVELSYYQTALAKRMQKQLWNGNGTATSSKSQEDLPPELESRLEADIIAKAQLVIAHRISARRLRELRKHWLDELCYFQPSFELEQQTSRQLNQDLERLALSSLRRAANQAAYALRNSKEAASMLVAALDAGNGSSKVLEELMAKLDISESSLIGELSRIIDRYDAKRTLGLSAFIVSNEQ